MNRLTTYALGRHSPVPSVWEAGTQSAGRGTQACMAAVLSLCVFLLAACTDGSSSPRSASTPMPAEVVVVRQARWPVTNDVTGSVVSDGRIDVASRVTGFIRQLDVREGQAVRRGDLLLRIDASDIDAAIAQARAGVQAAQEAWRDAQHDANQNAQLAPAGAISADALRKSRVREETTARRWNKRSRRWRRHRRNATT